MAASEIVVVLPLLLVAAVAIPVDPATAGNKDAKGAAVVPVPADPATVGKQGAKGAAVAAPVEPATMDAKDQSDKTLDRLRTRFSSELGLDVPDDEIRWLLTTSKAMGVKIDDDDDDDEDAEDTESLGSRDADVEAEENPSKSKGYGVLPELPGVPGSSVGMAAVSGVPGVPAVQVPAFPTKSAAVAADLDAIPKDGETSSSAFDVGKLKL